MDKEAQTNVNPLGIAAILFEAIQEEQLSKNELDVVKKSGIHNVEVMFSERGFDYRNEAFVLRKANELRSMKIHVSSVHANFGTNVQKGLFSDISVVEERWREMAVENMKVSIDAATILGAATFVIHAGDETSSEDREDRTRQSEKSLGELLEHCKGKAIAIALENMPAFCVGGSCEAVVGIVDRLNHAQLGICLDTGHLHVNGEQLVDSVRSIGTRLRSLHIHDNNGEDDNHLMPLDGTIDWRGFSEALKDIGFDGVLMYEVSRLLPVQEPLPDILKRVNDTFKAIFE